MTYRRRTGFTLIELLVVIAIIAILAAILFPVFARAREKARQITCVSNLKQLGTAVSMYSQDYDEFLPNNYLGKKDTNLWSDLSGSGLVDPYLKNKRILVLPQRYASHLQEPDLRLFLLPLQQHGGRQQARLPLPHGVAQPGVGPVSHAEGALLGSDRLSRQSTGHRLRSELQRRAGRLQQHDRCSTATRRRFGLRSSSRTLSTGSTRTGRSMGSPERTSRT